MILTVSVMILCFGSALAVLGWTVREIWRNRTCAGITVGHSHSGWRGPWYVAANLTISALLILADAAIRLAKAIGRWLTHRTARSTGAHADLEAAMEAHPAGSALGRSQEPLTAHLTAWETEQAAWHDEVERQMLVIPSDTPRLLTSRDVQRLFRVGPKAVRAAVAQGRLTEMRTPGGARRFAEAEVLAHLRGETPMIVSSGAVGGEAPASEETHRRPAVPLGSGIAGLEDAGSPGVLGGSPGVPCVQAPRTREGSRR